VEFGSFARARGEVEFLTGNPFFDIYVELDWI